MAGAGPAGRCGATSAAGGAVGRAVVSASPGARLSASWPGRGTLADHGSEPHRATEAKTAAWSNGSRVTSSQSCATVSGTPSACETRSPPDAAPHLYSRCLTMSLMVFRTAHRTVCCGVCCR